MSDKNFKVKNGLDANGAVTITQPTTSTVPLTILANTLATGSNLLEVKRPDGTVRLSIGNDGALGAQNLSALNVRFYSANSGSQPLILRGQASQTANLQEWRDVSENVLASVSAAGSISAVDLTLSGNLTVNGTTTNLNSTNLIIEDKNIIIADVATPTDTTADGAGITIKGATDKTLNWVQSTGSFTSSEPLIVNAKSATIVPLIARGYESQTSNFFEVQNSASNKHFVVKPPAGTALTDSLVFVKGAGTGGRATIGALSSYGNFAITINAGQSILLGTEGGGSSFEVVTGNTFNRYKVIGTGTGVAPVFTTDGNDTDVNMHIYPKGAGKIGINKTSPTGYVHVVSSSSSVVGLIVESVASQTANLQEWQSSAGSVIASVSSVGNFVSSNSTGYSIIGQTFYGSLNGGSTARVQAGSSVGANPHLVVRQVSAATGNLQEWQNSAETVLASISSTGKLTSAADALINGITLGWGGGQSYQNLAFGYSALANTTTGVLNMGMGYRALQANTTGWNNMALGADALAANTTGQANTAVGAQSLYSNTNGGENVAIGNWALLGGNGAYNVAVGASSMNSNSSSQFNTAVGRLSLYSISYGAHNTAIGQQAGGSLTSGASNAILGSEALLLATTGSNNIAIGRDAGHSVVTGSANIFLGYQAGYSETGSNKLYIANSNTATPLIGGDFSAKTLTVAGNASIISQATGTVGLIVRGYASQTADLQQWQYSDGNTYARITPYGQLVIGNANPAMYANARISLNTVATDAVGMVIRGVASQTANLQEWQNSSGTVLSSIGPNGTVYMGSTSGANIATFYNGTNGYGAGGINSSGTFNINGANMGFPYTSTGATLNVNAAASNFIPLTVKGVASQTADLQQWQNSSGTVLAKVDSAGMLVVGNTTGTIQVTSSGTSGSYPSSGAGIELVAGSDSATDLIQAYNRNTNAWRSLEVRAAGINFLSQFASSTVLKVKGYTSQTANLQEWQNSAGTSLASISSTGKLTSAVDASINGLTIGLGGGNLSSNIALGGSALLSNTTGYVNTAIGSGALQSNTTGWGNTGIGTYALQNYSGNVNTGIGYSALRYATAEGLVAIGFGALASNTSGAANTAVGYAALNANIIGGANTAFGSQSSRLSTGDRNTSVGFYSAYNLTTGTDNVFLGSQTGQSFTTGSSNVAIGSYNSWYGVSTGSNNTFIGADGGGQPVTGSNNTTLGYQATISSSSVSNEITLGNSSVTTFRIPGTGFISDTSKTYSAKELDLRNVSTQFTNTGTGSVGQKINLWGGVYGIGVENAALVNYIPSAASFVIKSTYGGGALFSVSGTGSATFSADLTVSGNLTVNGTTTNLNSTNLVIEDKNIIIADVATPTDTTADGAGITIKGATDKTFNWVQSTGRFTSSEPIQSSAFVSTYVYASQIGSTVIGTATLNTNSDTGGLLINTAGAANKGLIIRGAASQTANLQEWQESGGTVLSRIDTNGSFITKSGVASGSQSFSGITYNGFSNPTGITSVPTLVVKAIGSQTANLQEWQDSSGTVITRIDSSGQNIWTYSIRPQATPSSGSFIQLDSNQVRVTQQTAGAIAFIVKGATSQTASLQEWQDSSGNVLSRISSAGSVFASNSGTRLSGVNGDLISIAATATVVPITSRGFTSQTANLQEWQNSSGTVLSNITSFGGARLYDLGIKGGPEGIGWAYFGNDNTSTKNVVVRGFASQTADLQQWQNSAGGVLANVDSAGNLKAASIATARYVAELNSTTPYLDFSSNKLIANSRNASYVGFIVQGTASQSANLQEWQNSAGTVLINVNSAGDFSANSSLSQAIRFRYLDSPVIDGAYIDTRLATGTLGVVARSTTAATFVAKGAASQTADLQQWQNSAGTVLALVDAYGRLGINSTSLANSSGAYSMVSIYNNNTVNTNLVIKSYPSQTANLQEWQNSAGTALAKVDNLGNFTAISKSFDIVHPTKENMRLRYGSLEGPENGVYIRGITESSVIELPEYWTGLVHEDSITVSLTSVGSSQNIYVEKIENNKIYIGGNLEKAFFTVYGERKDIDKLTVEY